ncbi:uncharacterized protein [Rutidosis leptorrhynchoides]|uniref:uncharacterized protein n=1 Tax=Rutidosis leptorrhynchoides TaxID=125765 RepID=UPI003A9A0731
MVLSTRNTPDDNSIESVKAMIMELSQNMVNMNNQMNDQNRTVNEKIEGLLLQNRYFKEDIQRLRSGGEGTGRNASHYTRSTKLEFPKFNGDDVRGWLYKSQQFFSVDRIEEDEKVRISSIHLQDKALNWHQNYVRIHGEDIDWTTYAEAIQKRFGSVIDDPLSELKNLKQTGTVQSYYGEFERLINKLEVNEKYAISLFLGGLQKEIELAVRMFKPKTLEDALCLAKLQEDTIVAVKKRSAPLLPLPKSNLYSICSEEYLQP